MPRQKLAGGGERPALAARARAFYAAGTFKEPAVTAHIPTPSAKPRKKAGKLRKRLENSALLTGMVAGMMSAWIRLCDSTTRWERHGWDELQAALADGPVVLLLWHECSAFGMKHWPSRWGPLTSLTDSSPMGRVSGGVQRRMGLNPIVMEAKRANRAASRAVLRRLHDGVSIGLTGDGPTGPAREMKDAGLEWARATGVPVFLYAFDTERKWRLKTWDRMIWPKPFTRGVSLYARWDGHLPRKATPEAVTAARDDIASRLTALTLQAQSLIEKGR